MNMNALENGTKRRRPATAAAAAAGPAASRPSLAAHKAHPREARQDRYAHAFSQIVAVLMRDANFRNLALAQLEWLVIPAVMSGQWRLAQMKPEQVTNKADGSRVSNLVVPVAAALWANVSPEIDKRLAGNLDKPLLLRPNEWSSGDIPWLVAVAGDPRAIPGFLKALQESEFKGRDVKVRARGQGSEVVVKTLAEHAKAIAEAVPAPDRPAQRT